MFWESPDLLVMSGSHLYGYATPESDEDYIGFVVPPLKVELGILNRFEQKTPSKEELDAGDDKKIYSLRKFLYQLSRNDTQCLEILFAPESYRKVCTEVGEKVIKNRDVFITKQLSKRFLGYAYSEFRKIKGVAQVPQKQTPNEQKTIDQLRELFHPNKKTMDVILEMLYENRPKKEVSIYRKLGKKRKESIKKYGYSVKNAAHCIRLLMEGTEILNTGKITYPLSQNQLDILVKIRTGQSKFEEIEALFKHWETEIKKATDSSNLPISVDMNRVNEIFLEITLG